MDIKDLSPEQIEKARSLTTTEELVALAKEIGVDLSDEELDKVAGGDTTWDKWVGCTGQLCYPYDGSW